MNAHSRNILGKRENCALFEHEQSLFLSLKARAFERRTYERCALIDCSPEVSCERSSMKPCYVSQTILLVSRWSLHYHHHQSLNREGRWGTQMILQPVFSILFLFSTALWDFPNSRPVHSLMLTSHLFLCLPCLLPPFTVPCKMVLARPDEQEM